MIDQIQCFEQKVLNVWPLRKWSDLTVLLACSGGADSVAMVRSICRLATDSSTIVLAHYNHQLRGDESDADEQFVRELASSLNLDCIIGSASASDLNSCLQTSENSLRTVRYSFLEQTAANIGARYVATAHTADDQAETIVQRWCRGTGASGLCGIPTFRALGTELVIVRPMLEIWRQEVEQYLTLLNQSYRTDRSNHSEGYTRNRIRNSVLPLLESVVNSRARNNIVESSKSLSEIMHWLAMQSDELIESFVTFQCNSAVIAKTPLRPLHRALVKETLRRTWQQLGYPLGDMTHRHWDDLCELICDDASAKIGQTAHVFPGGIRVKCTTDSLAITNPQVSK